MTSVGHALTGAAVGVLCMPREASRAAKAAHLAAFVLLANVLDFPFPSWGHNLYYFSHSIFANLALIAAVVAVLALWSKARTRIGGWPVVIGGTAAWLSHLLLDSFYNHGKGVAIFGPFSEARLALPVAWFSVLSKPILPLTPFKLRIFLIEIACYGLLVLLAFLIRSICSLHKPRKVVK